jgi:hypothetical protein
MARLTRLSILALAAAIGLTLTPVGAANAVGPGTATLTFTSGGAPLADQFVSITAPDDPFGGGFTDAAGVLALADLALGSYSGAVTNPSAPPFTFSFSLTEAAPDFQGTFDVPAPPTGPGTMTLTLVSDTPVGFATGVLVSGPAGDRWADVSDGIATLSDLVLGDYTVQVLANPQHQGGSISFTLTEAEPEFVGELVLASWPTGTGSITGTVVGDAGQPLEGARVGLFSNGHSFVDAVTGADGTYTFSDLPAGVYYMSATELGYFSRAAEQTLADGEAAVVDFTLPAQNATISGRLVDGDGNPIADTYVDARSGTDFGGAMSAPDGTFFIPQVGAGEWTLVAGGGASPWLEAQVVVPLQSGENATVADIVLSPRTTGIIYGWVSDASSPYPQPIVGICATLLHPDGSVVPGPVETTFEDGGYYFTDLEPGSYTIRFTDCDPGRVPQYAAAYLGGSATLGDATVVTVGAGGFVQADPITLYPQVEVPEPTHDAKKPKSHDLTPATEGAIVAPATATQNQSFVIEVGDAYAGQWVSVWLFTPTKQLGEWHQVAADGTVEVTVPKKHPAGTQELVVQDSDDEVIGWTTTRIQKA